MSTGARQRRSAGTSLVDAALKAGTWVRMADGKMYTVHAEAPWGPASQPAPVGYREPVAE